MYANTILPKVYKILVYFSANPKYTDYMASFLCMSYTNIFTIIKLMRAL